MRTIKFYICEIKGFGFISEIQYGSPDGFMSRINVNTGEVFYNGWGYNYNGGMVEGSGKVVNQMNQGNKIGFKLSNLMGDAVMFFDINYALDVFSEIAMGCNGSEIKDILEIQEITRKQNGAEDITRKLSMRYYDVETHRHVGAMDKEL